MAEIEAATREEQELRKGLGLREVFLGKGNAIRFIIAFVMFLLQQWSGQNSIMSVWFWTYSTALTLPPSYYAPEIFASVITSFFIWDREILIYSFFRLDTPGQRTHFLPLVFSVGTFSTLKFSTYSSTHITGIVKVVTVTLFIAFGVETVGRRYSLFISALGMGILFFIVGAIFKTHPPPATSAKDPSPTPSHASQAMAAMLYLEGCFYVIGWGG